MYKTELNGSVHDASLGKLGYRSIDMQRCSDAFQIIIAEQKHVAVGDEVYDQMQHAADGRSMHWWYGIWRLGGMGAKTEKSIPAGPATAPPHKAVAFMACRHTHIRHSNNIKATTQLPFKRGT